MNVAFPPKCCLRDLSISIGQPTTPDALSKVFSLKMLEKLNFDIEELVVKEVSSLHTAATMRLHIHTIFVHMEVGGQLGYLLKEGGSQIVAGSKLTHQDKIQCMQARASIQTNIYSVPRIHRRSR